MAYLFLFTPVAREAGGEEEREVPSALVRHFFNRVTSFDRDQTATFLHPAFLALRNRRVGATGGGHLRCFFTGLRAERGAYQINP